MTETRFEAHGLASGSGGPSVCIISSNHVAQFPSFSIFAVSQSQLLSSKIAGTDHSRPTISIFAVSQSRCLSSKIAGTDQSRPTISIFAVSQSQWLFSKIHPAGLQVSFPTKGFQFALPRYIQDPKYSGTAAGPSSAETLQPGPSHTVPQQPGPSSAETLQPGPSHTVPQQPGPSSAETLQPGPSPAGSPPSPKDVSLAGGEPRRPILTLASTSDVSSPITSPTKRKTSPPGRSSKLFLQTVSPLSLPPSPVPISSIFFHSALHYYSYSGLDPTVELLDLSDPAPVTTSSSTTPTPTSLQPSPGPAVSTLTAPEQQLPVHECTHSTTDQSALPTCSAPALNTSTSLPASMPADLSQLAQLSSGQSASITTAASALPLSTAFPMTAPAAAAAATAGSGMATATPADPEKQLIKHTLSSGPTAVTSNIASAPPLNILPATLSTATVGPSGAPTLAAAPVQQGLV
ncbi:hypothetical protein D9C73_003395 [Collichthys lucidus]|uniref:Uncharacterized protein n=1 Tax=Collichthys lucidus TaxID=240159 RepID=A0A4U5U6S3_COLLU|nr:hypothetical protein D9C73_003395 [Collichthys lucidus]